MPFIKDKFTAVTATWYYRIIDVPRNKILKCIVLYLDGVYAYVQSRVYIGSFSADPSNTAGLIHYYHQSQITATNVGITHFVIQPIQMYDMDIDFNSMTWAFYQGSGSDKNVSLTVWYR